MKDRMDDPTGGDPLHLPDQHDVVEAVTGFVEEAAVFVADLVENVAEALGFAEDEPETSGEHDAQQTYGTDPYGATAPAVGPGGYGVGDGTQPVTAAEPSIEDQLTAAYENPGFIGTPAGDTGAVAPPDPFTLPADVTDPAPSPFDDPVIAEVATFNPAAADTMAFIQGVLHADPDQLNAMNAQLQGIVAQDEIHNSVARHEARQAESDAYHQAVQDADRTVTEAEGVIRRDPT
ncbi:hypothetical protein ACWEQL_21830 [Kitasatospora sp. NPDC004240]